MSSRSASALSIEDPHAPHMALRKYERIYAPETLQLYPTKDNELESKPRRYKVKWQAQGSDKATEEDKRHFMAVYYGMVSWVDEQIGRVLDALRARGLEEDTIVVFTSDHGEFCFEHNMCKKDLVMMDSLLHVSLFISWPGHLTPAVISGTLAEECDVMPTLLDLMGIAAPKGVQGATLVPLLRGETREHKDEVFAEECTPGSRNPYPDYASFRADWDKHHLQPGHPLAYTASYNVPGDFTKSVRTRDMKYIWYISGEEELYDLKSDPHEYTNLASDPRYATAKCAMKSRLLDWTCTSENTLGAGAQAALQAQYPDWTGIPTGSATGH